jgi:hypothetical protein
MALDIQGFLMNHTKKRDYERMFRRDDGRYMTATEAKATLLSELASGKRMLPFGDCDGFDFQTGCPGHPVEESA